MNQYFLKYVFIFHMRADLEHVASRVQCNCIWTYICIHTYVYTHTYFKNNLNRVWLASAAAPQATEPVRRGASPRPEWEAKGVPAKGFWQRRSIINALRCFARGERPRRSEASKTRMEIYAWRSCGYSLAARSCWEAGHIFVSSAMVFWYAWYSCYELFHAARAWGPTCRCYKHSWVVFVQYATRLESSLARPSAPCRYSSESFLFSASSAIRGLWGAMRRGFGVDAWTGLKSLSMVSFPWLIKEIQYEEKRVIKFYLFRGSLQKTKNPKKW